jgi:hypothetical protein
VGLQVGVTFIAPRIASVVRTLGSVGDKSDSLPACNACYVRADEGYRLNAMFDAGAGLIIIIHRNNDGRAD